MDFGPWGKARVFAPQSLGVIPQPRWRDCRGRCPSRWKLPYLLDDGTVGLRRLPMAISAILKTYRGVRFGANLEAATRTFSFAWQGPPLARESCRRPCRMTRPTVTGFSPASWTRRASSRRCGLPAPRRRPSHRRRLEESVSKMSEDESRHGGGASERLHSLRERRRSAANGQ